MSEDVTSPLVTKKERKHKDGSGKKSKKRQREDEGQDENTAALEPATGERPQKSKKRKTEEQQKEVPDAKSTVTDTQAPADATPVKKLKKKRKSEQPKEQVDASELANEVEDAGKVKKNNKKRKASEQQPEAEELPDAKPQPEVEINGVEQPSKKPKEEETIQEQPDIKPPASESAEASNEPNGAEQPKKKKRKDKGVPDEQTGEIEAKPAQQPSFSLNSKKPLKKPKPAVSQAQTPATQPSTSQIFPHSQQSNAAKATVLDNSEHDAHSPFAQQTASLYLSLSPIAHNFPLEGLCAEHISSLLMTYFPPLHGVIMSYSNPRLSEHPEQGAQAVSSKQAKVVLSRSIDEYAVTYVWLTADFTIFRPGEGTVLEGYVNLQNESILGLVCYNYFNAGIERSRLPGDWSWTGDADDSQQRGRRKEEELMHGYYVDGNGKKVDGRVLFRVRDFEASPSAETGIGSISILGTLLSEDDDRRLDEREQLGRTLSEKANGPSPGS